MGRLFKNIIPMLIGLAVGVFFGDTIKEKLKMGDKNGGGENPNG